jgi:glycine betaine/proline transport system substrate-binding protein
MKSKRVVLAIAALMSTMTACGGSSSTKTVTLAVNPWTGSKVNAEVAKVVLESKLGAKVTLVALDESPTWPALDSGSVDAVLEVWPSGHVDDKAKYIDEKKSVVDIGVLGPKAKIGWYVNEAALAANPKFATIDGFKDAAATKAFATAESGDQGQFLMGDPGYVTFDKQIIDNLKLPLKYVESGSEATLITAIQNSEKDKKPLLLQFWQPHWLHSKVKLTEVKLPAVSAECSASAAAKDGKYNCDYPVDNVYKAASAKLKGKNAKAFAFLSKMQLTTEQQNEIAAMIDGDGKASDVAAKTWVDAHADIVKAWLA